MDWVLIMSFIFSLCICSQINKKFQVNQIRFTCLHLYKPHCTSEIGQRLSPKLLSKLFMRYPLNVKRSMTIHSSLPGLCYPFLNLLHRENQGHKSTSELYYINTLQSLRQLFLSLDSLIWCSSHNYPRVSTNILHFDLFGCFGGKDQHQPQCKTG